MKTIAYIRVSTDEQADKGVSLDAQKAKVQGYASLYDLDLVDVVVDAGASAKTLKREGLQDVLTRLEKGEAEAVLVAKLDRLTRSVKDLGELIESYFGDRFALLSVAEHVDTRTAAGRLVLNILASVSQWEREEIGERTKTALQFKKAQGQRVGHIPFGQRVTDDGVTLEYDQAEQAVLHQLRGLRASGLSYRAIADGLNKRGAFNRDGEWNHVAVYRIANRKVA